MSQPQSKNLKTVIRPSEGALQPDIRIRAVRSIKKPKAVPVEKEYEPVISRMKFSVKAADGRMYGQYLAKYDTSNFDEKYKQVDNEKAWSIAQNLSNKIHKKDPSIEDFMQVTVCYQDTPTGLKVYRSGSRTYPGEPVSLPSIYEEDFGAITEIHIIFGVPF